MAADLSEALADAALNATEKRVVERIVASLCRALGDDLLALWLYGSRARGEADPTETDADRRSDIDIMVVVARNAEATGWDVLSLVEEAADAEGDSPVYYSVLVRDAEWLADRREIHSFFVQEVDRDKIVLAGGALERGEGE